jgi:uncharacterized protein
LTIAIYLLIGVLAGVLSGMFGIGGGIIMVIAMVVVMKLPFLTATGTSLGAMILPVTAIAAYEYYKAGNLEIKISLLLAVGLATGAWVGAKIAHQAGPAVVQRMFAVFLVIMAVRLWVGAR